MKNYVLTIIIAAVVLMLFPFLGLSEFWEHLFVIIPAFVIGYSGVWLLRNFDRLTEGSGTDSLQEYIDSLKKRFRDQKRKHQGERDAHFHRSSVSESDPLHRDTR